MISGIKNHVELQSMSTLAVPAVAEHFIEIEYPEQVEALLDEARQHDWPITVLGEGSNVVLADRLPGLTLRQSRGPPITPSTTSPPLRRRRMRARSRSTPVPIDPTSNWSSRASTRSSRRAPRRRRGAFAGSCARSPLT